jgi:hypothetical protein
MHANRTKYIDGLHAAQGPAGLKPLLLNCSTIHLVIELTLPILHVSDSNLVPEIESADRFLVVSLSSPWQIAFSLKTGQKFASYRTFKMPS